MLEAIHTCQRYLWILYRRQKIETGLSNCEVGIGSDLMCIIGLGFNRWHWA